MVRSENGYVPVSLRAEAVYLGANLFFFLFPLAKSRFEWFILGQRVPGVVPTRPSFV